MIKSIFRIACQFLYFIHTQTTEITHLMTKKNIMFFVTCFFRRMRSEYQSLPYLFYLTVELIVQIKSGRQTMRFIEMIKFRIETQYIHQLCSANTHLNILRYFGS